MATPVCEQLFNFHSKRVVRRRMTSDVDIVISVPGNLAAPTLAPIRLVPKINLFATEEAWRSGDRKPGTIITVRPPGDSHRHGLALAGSNHVTVM